MLYHHHYHVHCDHQDNKDLKLAIFHHVKHHSLIAVLYWGKIVKEMSTSNIFFKFIFQWAMFSTDCVGSVLRRIFDRNPVITSGLAIFFFGFLAAAFFIAFIQLLWFGVKKICTEPNTSICWQEYIKTTESILQTLFCIHIINVKEKHSWRGTIILF